MVLDVGSSDDYEFFFFRHRKINFTARSPAAAVVGRYALSHHPLPALAVNDYDLYNVGSAATRNSPVSNVNKKKKEEKNAHAHKHATDELGARIFTHFSVFDDIHYARRRVVDRVIRTLYFGGSNIFYHLHNLIDFVR